MNLHPQSGWHQEASRREAVVKTMCRLQQVRDTSRRLLTRAAQNIVQSRDREGAAGNIPYLRLLLAPQWLSRK